MAAVTFKKGDEYLLKLSRLGAASEEVSKKAIYEGAKIVADQIRSNMNSVLSGESTGDMAASLGITPIKVDSNGNYNAKIGFDGYDSKGVPNQLKARAMESGTSKMKKRPFVRPAVNATKSKVIKKMKEVIDQEIENLM